MESVKKLNKNYLRAAIFGLISLVVVGALIFHHLEDWTWIESFYFTVVTITTVGYGDIHPTSDESRLVAMGFILVGVSLAGGMIAYLGKSISVATMQQRIENKVKAKAKSAAKKATEHSK